MRVPLSAIWPPIALLLADLLVMPVLALWSWWLVLPFAAGAIILCFDIAGRRADFRLAARHLAAGRRPVRVAKNYQFSWCGRVACAAAATAVSPAIGKTVADHYSANGYRWYHIFPDGAFTRNSPFLSLRFWQITLGGNTKAAARLAISNDAVDSRVDEIEDDLREAA